MQKAKKLNGAVFLLCLILLPSFVAAQAQEYKDYTIVKGDTLWDISNKELKDPFLWPKIWKENTEIKNPDKIYPGEKIKIPLYLVQKEIVPKTKPVARVDRKPEAKMEKPPERKVEPVNKEYLVNKYVLIAGGYIADSAAGVGVITDSQNSDKSILSKGDYAYIQTDSPIKRGGKFFIFQVAEKVIHPKSGRKLGYLIDVLGTAEVESVEKTDTKVLITNSFADIPVGSLLSNYYEIEPPLAPENPRKPDINGYIVATRQLHVANGIWDIVYIDKGSDDGLEVGDLLATTLQSEHKIINGQVQIINLRGKTSTAIIRKSKIETSVGDAVTGVKQE
jgi:LysM repeat protein